MIRPSSKAISEIIEKLKTLKTKEADFLNKKGSTATGKVDEITEELANKYPTKLTFEQKGKLKVDTTKMIETLNNYEKIKIKPKEYWPDDIQSLINEVEKLMFPYGKELRAFGELTKTGIRQLDDIIQELEKIKYKIEVEAQQKASGEKTDLAKRPWYKGVISWIFKKTSHIVCAIIFFIISTIAATILIDFLANFGWLERIEKLLGIMPHK